MNTLSELIVKCHYIYWLIHYLLKSYYYSLLRYVVQEPGYPQHLKNVSAYVFIKRIYTANKTKIRRGKFVNLLEFFFNFALAVWACCYCYLPNYLCKISYIVISLQQIFLFKIPENNALSGLAGALISAWRLYSQPKSVILFLVEDVTYNVCDQKFHEFEIRRQCPEVFVIRRTLTEIGNRGKLTADKRLIIDGQEVAVIYMRCGYHPDQYPTGLDFYFLGG